MSRQMGHRNCSSDNRLLLDAISLLVWVCEREIMTRERVWLFLKKDLNFRFLPVSCFLKGQAPFSRLSSFVVRSSFRFRY